MTHAQAVEELLQKCETLLAQGETRQASVLLDKVLRLDFVNARAWQMLHGLIGQGRPLEVFQREFAQKYYPARAHLLEPLDLIPLPPPEAAPENPPPAPAPVEGAVCVYCGRYNPPGTPLCLVCGATLAAPAAPPVDARAEEQACPRCGHQNAAQARFCAQCGKGLLQADEPIPAPPPAVLQGHEPALVPPPQTAVPTVPAPQVVVLQGHEPALTPPAQTAVPSAPAAGGGAETSCPNCGRGNPHDARLCAYCGYDFFYRRVVTAESKAQRERPVFRFHFVDIGDLVVVLSLFLPWDSSTGILYIPYLLNVWGVIAKNDFGGWIIAFIVTALGASILVRARHRLLAGLSAVGSVVSLVVAAEEMGSTEVGVPVAFAGTLLVLMGVIFFENERLSQWLSIHRKTILLGIAAVLGLAFVGFLVFTGVDTLQMNATTSANRTRYAQTSAAVTQIAQNTALVRTQRAQQTGAVNTQAAGVKQKTAEITNATATAVARMTQSFLATRSPAVQTRQASVPAVGADFQKYQVTYKVSSLQFGDRIYTANADGSDARQVVATVYKFQNCPRVSPNRKLMAFSPITRANSSIHEVWLADANGNNPRKITDGDCPVWSPDSQALYFISGSAITKVNIDGSGRTKVKDSVDSSSPNAYAFSVSPDGRTLVYTSKGILYALSLSNGNTRALTSAAIGKVRTPNFSPDGNWIAFSMETGGQDTDIYLMQLNGTGLHRLTFDSLGNFTPYWSPDGVWVGFVGRNGNGFLNFVVRADGSGRLQRIPLSGSEFFFVP